MNILVLSPHRGDAAFSLALAIEKWLALGHRVTIFGVFTRSLHAPYSDAETVHPNDRLSYVSAMRRREDEELLKLMPGLRMVDLNLKDASLRLRCAAEELYMLPVNPDDPALAKIQKALGKLAAEQEIDAVLLPLALGHNIDHLVVRKAASGFALTRACAFFEDIPDTLPIGQRTDGTEFEGKVRAEIAAVLESNGVQQALGPVVLQNVCKPDAAVTMKRGILSIYASQIDDQTIQSICSFALRYGGGERVWANPAWLALSA